MENKLKDWSLTTKRAQWKKERKELKLEADRKKGIITDEAESRAQAIKANAEMTIRKIYIEGQEKKAAVDRWLADEYIRIAKEQDEYEMEFRQYVASLPEELRGASVVMERGGKL